ncbi:hypothetical protein F5B21DRAFT_464802 [Xylaria acuta]|nr:hypothetical protein F5B21DRAFT_464802 [Xylaria acuta]
MSQVSVVGRSMPRVSTLLAPLTSTIYSVKHEHHKRRRNAVNHCFPTASVNNGQHLVGRLVCRISQFIDPETQPGDAVSAFTRDGAGEYSMGNSPDNLGQDDFNVDLSKFSENSGKFWRIRKHVRCLNDFINMLPLSFIEKTSNSSVKAFFAYLKVSFNLTYVNIR